jgi:hypothetical protein
LIKVVSIDLWNTLIESEQGPFESYTLMELESVRSILSEVKNVNKEDLMNAYLSIARYRDIIKPETYVKLLCNLIGFSNDNSTMNRVIEAYLNAGSEYIPRITPGATRFLEYLKKRRIKSCHYHKHPFLKYNST